MCPSESISPEELIRLATNGDGEALGRLLTLHRGYLKVLAEVEIGNRLQAKVDASDVVQEACLAAHQAFPSFEGTSEIEFQVWLRRILANRLLMLVRHYFGTKGRDIRLERELADSLDRSAENINQLFQRQPSPSQAASRREQSLSLADALTKLPDDLRQVIVLHDLHGHSFREIATQMQRPTSTVERLWMRALTKLRHFMGEAKS